MKNVSKRISAVYTVEAALVLGISLMSLLLLLFFSFSLRDRLCLESEMYRLAKKAAEEKWEEEEIFRVWEEEACPLLYLQVGEKKVYREENFLDGETEVILSAGVSIRESFGGGFMMEKWFAPSVFFGEITVKAKSYRPQEFIRKLEAVKEVFR